MDTERKETRKLCAIIFTDAVGSTQAINLEEEKFVKIILSDLGKLREFASEFDGRVVKGTGDGLLITFDSCVNAIKFALHAQQAFLLEKKGLAKNEVVLHRIGVHFGDVIVTSDDVYGNGVNAAARIQSEGSPGAIIFSRSVYDIVRSNLDKSSQPVYIGTRRLKGINEDIGLFEYKYPDKRFETAAVRIPSPAGMIENKAGVPIKRREFPVRQLLTLMVLAGLCFGLFMFWKPIFNEASKLVSALQKAANSEGKAVTKPIATTPSNPKAQSSGKAGPSSTGNQSLTAGAEVNQNSSTRPATGRTPQPNRGNVSPGVSPDDLEQNEIVDNAMDSFFSNYDYGGFIDWLNTNGYASEARFRNLAQRTKQIQNFVEWADRTLKATSEENAIKIRTKVSGEVLDYSYYGRDGFIEENVEGAVSSVSSFTEIDKDKMSKIGAQLVRGGGARYAQGYNSFRKYHKL